MAAFYRKALGLTPRGENEDAITLDMGDGAQLAVKSGGQTHTYEVDDREEVTMVPVFRLYDYDGFKAKMIEMDVPCLQEVDLIGGRLWYGWDPAGYLFGFQERWPPDPDKWTTRLPEDLLARRLWEVQ